MNAKQTGITESREPKTLAFGIPQKTDETSYSQTKTKSKIEKRNYQNVRELGQENQNPSVDTSYTVIYFIEYLLPNYN